MNKTNKKAEDYFHCEGECYNCAQAILKAFQKQFNIADETIKEYKKYGGGQADDNMCGALFAVMQLLKEHPEKSARIKEEFAKIVGATKCKEIRSAPKEKRIPCRECVKIAAELLEKHS